MNIDMFGYILKESFFLYKEEKNNNNSPMNSQKALSHKFHLRLKLMMFKVDKIP